MIAHRIKYVISEIRGSYRNLWVEPCITQFTIFYDQIIKYDLAKVHTKLYNNKTITDALFIYAIRNKKATDLKFMLSDERFLTNLTTDHSIYKTLMQDAKPSIVTVIKNIKFFKNDSEGKYYPTSDFEVIKWKRLGFHPDNILKSKFIYAELDDDVVKMFLKDLLRNRPEAFITYIEETDLPKIIFLQWFDKMGNKHRFFIRGSKQLDQLTEFFQTGISVSGITEYMKELIANPPEKIGLFVLRYAYGGETYPTLYNAQENAYGDAAARNAKLNNEIRQKQRLILHDKSPPRLSEESEESDKSPPVRIRRSMLRGGSQSRSSDESISEEPSSRSYEDSSSRSRSPSPVRSRRVSGGVIDQSRIQTRSPSTSFEGSEEESNLSDIIAKKQGLIRQKIYGKRPMYGGRKIQAISDDEGSENK